MRTRYFFLLVGLSLTSPNFRLFAEENAPPVPAISKAEETNSLEVLRTYLQLQEQLRGLQLSLDQKSKEVDAAVARNAQTVAGRLEALEQTFAGERARDLDAIHNSNRLIMIVSAAFPVSVR